MALTVLILPAGIALVVFIAHMRAMLDRNRRASADLEERLQGQVKLP